MRRWIATVTGLVAISAIACGPGTGGSNGGRGGTTGGAGASGRGGTTGSAGASGRGGTTGSAGASGTMGTAGASGTTGSGGSAGSAGSGGTNGGTGASGQGGAAGDAGTAGSAGASDTTGAAGATGGAGASGRGGTTGGAGATGGAGNTAGGDGGISFDAPIGSDAICTATVTAARIAPLELFVLLDSSLSMLQTTAVGSTKWAAVTSALSAFFSDQASSGITVALKLFPAVQTAAPATCTADAECGSFGPCDRRKTCVASAVATTVVAPACVDASTCGSLTCSLIRECPGNNNYCAYGPTAPAGSCGGCTDIPGYCHARDVCSATSYATTDFSMTTLPSTALGAALATRTPAGYTPTGPAVAGALAFARQRLATSPDTRLAVLLVTDGLPGGFIPGFAPAECSPSDIPGIAAVLAGAQGRTGTPPVLTYVMGVFAAAETSIAQTNLDTLATGGGTAPAIVVDTSPNLTTQLLAALARVRSKATACPYALPAGAADLDKVNVRVTTGTGTSVLVGRVTSKAACTAAGGWSYVDAGTGTSTEIDLCDATCQQVQADPGAQVEFALGCPTITTP